MSLNFVMPMQDPNVTTVGQNSIVQADVPQTHTTHQAKSQVFMNMAVNYSKNVLNVQL